MFDENIHSVLGALGDKLNELKQLTAASPEQAARCRQETEGCIAALSRLQRALSDMTREIAPQREET